MHHNDKIAVLSKLICLHFYGFVVKEEIGLKVSGANWGVDVANAHGQQIDFSQNSSRAVRAGGWADVRVLALGGRFLLGSTAARHKPESGERHISARDPIPRWRMPPTH